MAEGLLRDLASNLVDVYSADTNPSKVNPFAIQAMNKRNIDITNHTSDSIEKYTSQEFDYVITVCDNAAETSPVFVGRAQRIHWSLPYPSAVGGDDNEILVSFIKVCDELEVNLTEWVKSLN